MNEQKKQFIIDQLIKNPKYDSEWIDKASTLLAIDDSFSTDILETLSADQIEVLSDAIISNNSDNPNKVNINSLTNNGKYDLNATQMKIISAGYKNGISDEVMQNFLDPNIPYVISNYIVHGIVEGFDMLKYLNGYDKDQVIEIYSAFKDGIDFYQFAIPSITAQEMYIIRCAINVGMNAYFNDNNELIIKRENNPEKEESVEEEFVEKL